MTLEKRVSYKATASYSTLNTLTPKTRNIWLVFHGMGYLGRYFLRYFSDLNPEENYIIAPQAPSKYYIGPDFKHVGASWLTREDTLEETKNVLEYIDAVCESEQIPDERRFLVLGYSQGVSIATRWLANRKIQCDQLILHSGGIPKELKSPDFHYMNAETGVTYLYGTEDEYITEARKTEESLKGNNLFGDKLQMVVFPGIHEVSKEFLQKIAQN